ncbi:MAG: hypothetical protein IPL52_10365 [Flavobacteriales bacterium]|nr:hypothetical protein [Flavobacteriales bacterium]
MQRHNNATTDDIIQPDCTCAGTLLDNDHPENPADPHCPHHATTTAHAPSTTLPANCDCAGTPVNTDDDDACHRQLRSDPAVIHTPVDPG